MGKTKPRWSVALLALAGAGVVVGLWPGRVWHDLWPPDASAVGPNLVASLIQAGLVLIVMALVWPPFRHAIHRFLDRKLEAVQAEIHEKLEHNKALMEHLIHHSPKVPPYEPPSEGA